MTVGIQKSRALSNLRTAARPAPPLDISLKGLGALIVKVSDTLLDWQERARQRHRLGEMDDHLLRDIGLSRADLEHESAKPFWRA
jgi:uncharacterized protein YjiS (DUF1127 family)